MRLSKHRRNWHDLGELDPYWAVLSDPAKRFGRWDTAEFFATGEREVATVLGRAKSLGYPAGHAAALDFGCGLGRTTRALATRFERCVGVDIADTMVRAAQELNADVPACSFAVNDGDGLAFADASFDLVYSNIVLQHQPSRRAAERYIAEFVRVLKPDGLAVFQVPHRIPLIFRLQPHRRLYSLLHALGVPKETLYRRLKLAPIRMGAVPELRVRATVTAAGGKVLAVDHDTNSGPHVDSRTYYVTK